MLKWTVAQSKSRTPTSVSVGPCLSIRRAAARLHLRRSAPASGVASRRVAARAASARGKENDGYHSDGVASPRSRDSVYMRLDALPAALRDLSNRIPTPKSAGSTPPTQKTPASAGAKRSRSRSRRALRQSLPCRPDGHRPSLPDTRAKTVTPAVSTSSVPLVPSAARPSPPKCPPEGVEEQDETSQNCINNSLVRQRLAGHAGLDPDLQIDYSPCPLRATRSLAALRRRLADTFSSASHSAGAMPTFDNPLYFLNLHDDSQVNPLTSSATLNVEDEPSASPACRDSLDVSDKSVNSEPDSVLEEKSFATTLFAMKMSPLTRNLSCLKLNGSRNELEQSRTAPSLPVVTRPSLINHDATDAKLLSLQALMDSPNAALNLMRRSTTNSRSQTQSDKQSDTSCPIGQEELENGLNELNLCATSSNSKIRKRSSLHRVRTLSEDGPPLKAQPILLSNGHLAMPRASVSQPIKTPPKDTECIRLPYKRRRKSDRRRTRSVGEDEDTLIGVGDGVFTSSGNCDSLLADTEADADVVASVELASLDSSNEEFTLKRQGCIRRRPKNKQGKPVRNPQFGVTLPFGLPSPFSPEYATAWFSKMGPPQAYPTLPMQRKYAIAGASGEQDNVTLCLPRPAGSSVCGLVDNGRGLTIAPPKPRPFTASSMPVEHKSISETKNTTQFTNSTFIDTHCASKSTSFLSGSSNFFSKSTAVPKSGFFSESLHSSCKPPETATANNRFGLTLSRGIPSPPTPVLREHGAIAGVQPIVCDVAGTSHGSDDTLWKVGVDDALREEMQVEDAWKGTAPRSVNDDWSTSDDTWNSHNMQEMNASQATSAISGCRMQDDGNSVADFSLGMNDPDTREKDSFASAAPSPLAVVERRSRSRRCLRFTSPGGSIRQRRTSRRSTSATARRQDENLVKGELDLEIYENSGLITIHVISGKNLHKAGGRTSNAYVKVALVPSSEERTFHRTAVHRDSSAPRFDQKFSFELFDSDLDKRVLVSVWHRDKERRRSEFLGCMSFAVQHAVKKEVSGSFRLLSQSAGASRCEDAVQSGFAAAEVHQPVMPSLQSDSSTEEVLSLVESIPATPVERRRAPCPPRKPVASKPPAPAPVHDDSSFLRHLELEGGDVDASGHEAAVAATPGFNKGGRTPFTTTRVLTRQSGSGFGFSIAWTQPPRIERVEPGQAADQAGLRPGDYVIFVDKCNVVTLLEDEILQLIRSCGNKLTLEVYRRAATNGLVKTEAGSSQSKHRAASISCSAATTTSLDLSKRRLHLPQVTFSSEAEPLNRADSRRRAVYQLVNKEQQYALCLQFGVARFLLPLSERKDLLTTSEHLTLFQNMEELLRLTEDILDQLVQEDHEPLGQSLGRIYQRKMTLMTNAYRRYCADLKQADCLLVAKTRNNDFMKLITEPVVPRRRPDLTAFLHKPLEHYREVLKLLQNILTFTKMSDDDYPAISRVVHELQVTYREMTSGAGLMEPEGEGRLLLSLQDLESRLVFTRCKPFVLSAPGRQWIFGGDLSRVEGRAVRPFWGLLFSDMILFAKVSRDRVLFITEEPLSLLAVTQACFTVKKKATDFRLLMDGGPDGADSPEPAKCGPDMTLTRNSKKNLKRRTVSLRAPTAELKAVWQNLIQRQIIYLNTARGGTPTSSPLESPDQPTTLSFATLDSLSLRRQVRQPRPHVPLRYSPTPTPVITPQTPVPVEPTTSSQRHLDELIERKCRQLGKSGATKGSALHLSQWMKGQLGGGEALTPDDEPITEVWTPRTLRRRSEQLQLIGIVPARTESRVEEYEISDTERSVTRSPSHSVDSQVTVTSPEHQVPVCRKCHTTCLSHGNTPVDNHGGIDDDPDYDDNDNWGPLILMGMSALKASIGLGSRATVDPFSPSEVPGISVMPPTPSSRGSTAFQWDDADLSSSAVRGSSGSRSPDTTLQNVSEEPDDDEEEEEDEEDDDSGDLGPRADQGPPYRALNVVGGLKRFGTLASLEMYPSEEADLPDAEDATDSEDEDDEWDSEADEATINDKAAEQNFEVVTQSLRGWTARAGSFVAEKMALFERLGEDSRAAAFLDRYLRPAADPPEQGSPPSGVTSSGGGEDECSNSVATSGEEIWGTPTSGGELLDDELARTGISFEVTRECLSSPGTSDDVTELMMDDLLSSSSLLGNSRGFPSRRRLEPLPEEDDVESIESMPGTPPGIDEEETPSPEQGKRAGGAADAAVPRMAHVASLTAQDILRHQPPSFFRRLSLRKARDRDRDDQPKNKTNSKLLGFLSGKKSGDGDSTDTVGPDISTTPGPTPTRQLFRLFVREAVDDIPTTLSPRQAALRLENASKQPMSNHFGGVDGEGKPKRPDKDKQLERRFWKQLRRRRNSAGSSGAVTSPSQVAT